MLSGACTTYKNIVIIKAQSKDSTPGLVFLPILHDCATFFVNEFYTVVGIKLNM